MELTPLNMIEIDREITNTKRLLEKIEDQHLTYKPHPKSMTLGELANHIVELHGWVVEGITKEVYDFHKDYQPSKIDNVAQLITKLESFREESKLVLEKFSASDWDADWKLMAGEHLIAQMPKVASFRFIIQNHLIHHRGQLTVYMRLLDIPLPGIYGPSADEKSS
ncbi:DinB family protein [Vaginella massiliensis]|uniref:DinB family protein n=1 Tax=Vaginella massiliensis TaxID=1816680 RepID=UPI000837D9D7|nr:DinB family protein [Vaginella massiliensis]